MQLSRMLLIPTLVAVLPGCWNPFSVPDKTITPSEKKEIHKTIDSPNDNSPNDFAFALYKNLSNDPANNKKNIFFSPSSITTAMEVTYEGARGKTAEEIAQTLHIPTDTQARRTTSKKLYETLNPSDAPYTLTTANALWIEQTFKVLPDYVATAREWYNADVINIDFQNNPRAAEQKINSWVEQQTHNLIKDLIAPGSLANSTRLVITNAIYFKGTWLHQFDTADTHEENFFVDDATNVQVPMMSLTVKKQEYKYGETDTAQILELDYAGNDLSMLILLPKDKNLTVLEQQLTSKNLAEWKRNMTSKEVDIYVPRTKLETDYALVPNFKEMGIQEAFTAQADFSGIDGNRDLYIGNIIHKAFLDMNEEGTEAAAATAVIMLAKALHKQTPVFRADHPFIILIQEKSTETILFMGRISNPLP